MVGHKSLSTKRLVMECLSDIETSELQSIANIPFFKFIVRHHILEPLRYEMLSRRC